MGWFSDDSEEDERPIAQKAETDQQQQQTEDDEDIDPLDAYMNSLDNSSTAVPSKLSHGGRLNHDAEDEVTSHW